MALFVVAAVLGAAAGAFFVYAADLPQISALDDYKPNTITRVYARGGEVVGEFATERRIIVSYDQISPNLRHAIMAAEDESFETHVGLSISRIILTLVRDLMEQRKAAGASTLTQQLARNLFLTPEKTWERKIREALLAIQIEKRYTKPEVFTLYANQIYLGHGAYGVEAASRIYFNKSAKDLTIDEAALIAGIIQSPSRQSPYVNMENALRRRNYALSRMATVGYISEARRRGRAQAAHRDDRPSRAARFGGAVLRRGGPQAPRVELRRAASLRARAQRPDGHSTCACRLPRTVPSRTGCANWTSGGAGGSLAETC